MSMQEQSGLRDLFAEMADKLLEDEETRDAFLAETGHDPGEVQEEGRAFLRKVQGQARRRIARRETASLEELKQKARAKLEELYEHPKNALKELLAAQRPDLAGAHFRKLEDVSEEDAIDMLEEMEVLKLLEQLEDEDR